MGLKETLISLFAFCSLRSKAGGVHARNGGKCFLIMTMVVLFSALFGSILKFPMMFKTIILMFCFLIVYKYAPSGENNTCILLKAQIKRKHAEAVIVFCLWCVAIYWISSFSNLSFLAISFECLTVYIATISDQINIKSKGSVKK